MKRAIFTTLSVVCAALPALSANLEFAAGGEFEYDDNVFRTITQRKDDELFRLRPGVRIYEEHGTDLNYSLGYEAPVELSVNYGNRINDADHWSNDSFTYHVNDRVELFGTDQYGYLRSTFRHAPLDTNTQSLGLGTQSFIDHRDRVTVNNGELGSRYHFSPRTVGELVADSTFFNSTRADRAEVWTAGATADLKHQLTLHHQIGVGAGYSYQDFGERLDISGSHTNTYRVFGTWQWSVTPTLTFDMNAGPAYLETEQNSAPPARVAFAVPFTLLAAQPVRSGEFFNLNGQPLANPDGSPVAVGPDSLLVSSFATQGVGGGVPNCASVNGRAVAVGCHPNIIINSYTDLNTVVNVLNDIKTMTNINAHGTRDTTVTGFVEAGLSQRWAPHLTSALRYTRSQGSAAGAGGTVIDDAVSLSNLWDFAERWQLSVRGDYVRRKSAFSINQTFDEVLGNSSPDPFPAGHVAIATRTGTSFNSSQHVEIATESWSVAGRITHQLFKTTSLYAQFRYSEQTSGSNTLGSNSDFTNFLATFGVRHVFEPIPLW